MRILIYGLSGAGKSTLANKLSDYLNYSIINGDRLREINNDWDFSITGRIRQAIRVRDKIVSYSNIIIDLVCPLHKMRDIINPDITILMDTIELCQYEDTNKMFEKGSPHITVTSFDYNLQDIINDIQNI